MKFNYIYFIFFTIFIIGILILGGSLEIIFFVWYFLRFIIVVKLYSHIRYILLVLEVLTLITIALIIYFILKMGLEFRFIYLFLCLVVGEARLGLSLLIISSRFQRIELLSLNLI